MRGVGREPGAAPAGVGSPGQRQTARPGEGGPGRAGPSAATASTQPSETPKGPDRGWSPRRDPWFRTLGAWPQSMGPHRGRAPVRSAPVKLPVVRSAPVRLAPRRLIGAACWPSPWPPPRLPHPRPAPPGERSPSCHNRSNAANATVRPGTGHRVRMGPTPVEVGQGAAADHLLAVEDGLELRSGRAARGRARWP